MAYVLPIDDEEEKKKAEEDAVQKQQAGGPSAGEPMPSSGGESPAQKTPTTTGYTDVRSYLEANRPQAQQLAQTMASRVAGEGEQLKTKLGEVESKFGEQVKSGAIPYAPEQTERIIQKATTNPSDWVKLPENVQAWKNVYGAQYKGPSELRDIAEFGDVSGKIGEAAKFGGQLETPSAQKELFYRYGTRPTVGNVTLDQMLLSGIPEAYTQIASAGKGLGQLGEYLTGRQTTAAEQAAAAKKATEETATKAGQALTGAVSGLETSLQERLAQRQRDEQKKIDALKQLIQTPGSAMTVNMPGYTQAGMSPSQWAQLNKVREMLSGGASGYGIDADISGYLKQTATPQAAYNIENIASPEEYAKEKALEELAGYNIPLLYNEALAGTAPQNLAQFDITGAYGDVYGKLAAEDAKILEATKGSSPNQIPQLQTGPAFYKGNAFEQQLRAYQRNRDKLTPGQAKWLGVMEGDIQSPFQPVNAKFLKESAEVPSKTLGEAWAPPPAPKTGGTQPESKLQVIDTPTGGKMKWWNGTAWVDAPKEFRYTKGGEQAGPMDFDKVEQFDYNTGTYKVIPTPAGGWKRGGRDPVTGINYPGNVPGMYYILGMPSQTQQQQIDQQSLEEYLNQFRQQATPAEQI